LLSAYQKASSGESLLSTIYRAFPKHLHIDLVLLDVRIPGVLGTEMADEILSIRPHVRVLWMSGFVHEDFIRVKLVDGYAGFLSKPLHRHGLLLAVQQAIAGPGRGETPGYQREKTLTAVATA
jgi:DNA-binding NarL/FixJ family response regulator